MGNLVADFEAIDLSVEPEPTTEDITPTEEKNLRALMEQCCLSTEATAKILFPDRFSLPFCEDHRRIIRLLDDDKKRKVAIVAPRGFGKTSLVNLAYAAKKILFREKNFIVPVSCSSPAAIMQSENLKMELLSNPYIVKIFGSMRSEYNFSKEMWETETGIAVMPRGAGQQVRGLLFKNCRPDLFIVDDIEDSEGVESEIQRDKLKRWFFGDLMRAVNEMDANWKIVVIGNMLHEDCLMANLLEDASWERLCLDICDDKLNSVWPELVSNETLAEEYKTYKEQGVLDTWFRERRCKVIATTDRAFPQSCFQWYDDIALMQSKKHLESVVVVDPAKTSTMQSAHSAIVGVGLDRISGKIYVRDIEAGTFYPDQLYDKTIEMAIRLRARAIGIEVTSLESFITYPFENELRRRGLGIEVVELKARGEKELRIKALSPFYRRGQIFHNPRVCSGLEAQLLSFPRSKRFDIMDALAYIVEMFDIGERFFAPVGATESPTEGEYKDVCSAEYEELEPSDDREWLVV